MLARARAHAGVACVRKGRGERGADDVRRQNKHACEAID
jgi:hypothetical protein